jgi:hypothetical protein
MTEYFSSLKTCLEQAINGEVRKVDMVEVVRCKDCVHKDVPCPLYGGSQFFCAYGERKEEDE